jgi:hypothetical protein
MVIGTKQRPQLGDLVLIFFKPDVVSSKYPSISLKRLVLYVRPDSGSNVGPCLFVEQSNPQKTLSVQLDAVAGLYRCLGLPNKQCAKRARTGMTTSAVVS